MSRIDFTLATPTHPEINWLNKLEGLKKEEIEELITILQDALAALFGELTDRREPLTDRAREDYQKKLQKITKQINKQRLTETHRGDLDSLKISLAQAGSAQVEREESQPSEARRQYLRFISNVLIPEDQHPIVVDFSTRLEVLRHLIAIDIGLGQGLQTIRFRIIKELRYSPLFLYH